MATRDRERFRGASIPLEAILLPIDELWGEKLLKENLSV